MRYSLLFLLLISFKGEAQRTQKYEHPEPLMLQAGEYSRIHLPEPYSSIHPAINKFQILKPPNHNRRIIYIQPITTKKLKTNIIILSPNYEFTLDVRVNYTNKPKTDLMDLITNIQAYEKLAPGLKKESKPVVKLPDTNIFSTSNLLKARPDLFNSSLFSPAIQKHNIKLSVNHIFYFKEKIVFKLSLKNNSSVPYEISKVAVNYKEFEREKLFFYRKHTPINEPLQIYKVKYMEKIIAPHTTGSLICITNKQGVKKNGKFEIVIREIDGRRTFKFLIPARIK